MDKRFEEMMLKRAEMMEQYGYIIDHVFGFETLATHDFGEGAFYNTHTHGLMKTFDHMELQIILPLPPAVALDTIHSVVDTYIKQGKTLEDGQELHGLVQGDYVVRVLLVEQLDDHKNITRFLRLLIPDVNNKVPTLEEDPSSMFAYQREMVFPKDSIKKVRQSPEDYIYSSGGIH